MGRKNFTQNDDTIINYWFKLLTAKGTKCIKHGYNLTLQDVEVYPCYDAE